jgi:hypothetical protein
MKAGRRNGRTKASRSSGTPPSRPESGPPNPGDAVTGNSLGPRADGSQTGLVTPTWARRTVRFAIDTVLVVAGAMINLQVLSWLSTATDALPVEEKSTALILTMISGLGIACFGRWLVEGPKQRSASASMKRQVSRAILVGTCIVVTGLCLLQAQKISAATKVRFTTSFPLDDEYRGGALPDGLRWLGGGSYELHIPAEWPKEVKDALERVAKSERVIDPLGYKLTYAPVEVLSWLEIPNAKRALTVERWVLWAWLFAAAFFTLLGLHLVIQPLRFVCEESVARLLGG